MKTLDSYSISFSALKQGTHRFDFLVEHPFFAEFEYSPLQEGRVWVNVAMSKHETMMVLDFALNGTVNVQCARCNEFFDFEISGEHRLVVKLGESTLEQTDEILILARTENDLPLAQQIYEFILLALPIRAEHPNDKKGNSTCNPETLAALEKISVKQKLPETDPRWDELRKLKTKN